jgi:uncharacterized protein (DUF488 family)
VCAGTERGLARDCGRESEHQPTLYTIGYEGCSKDEFVGLLHSHDIRSLVDVRELPWSRKPGFSKSPLRETLTANGISYMHLKPLGSPRKAREALKDSGDFEAFVRTYSEHLAAQTESLDLLISAARLQPTAIMCYERDPSRCHRSLIATRLSDFGFNIENL